MDNLTSRNSRACMVVFVIVSLLVSACAVDPDTAELTLDSRALQMAENAASAPPPTQQDDIAVNDAGEQLLQRFVQGSFAADDCDFVDTSELPTEPECGWLTRPLHGAYSDDIELPVLIFRATGPDPADDPLIYLHGGPSDGILWAFDSPVIYDLIVEPFVTDRDVIVFDQRGTGLAEPDLGCDNPAEWYNANDEDPETYVSRTARTCAKGLQFSDGIRLDQFSRQSSADDVMVLARELGYEQFSLHGSSWGGILAYTVMQLHPEWVRAAVLDSPLSIETDVTGSMPGSFHEAMLAMQANCDLDAACSARHGDIVARYIRVFDKLEQNPADVLIQGIFPLEINADELSYLLFSLFYSPEAIAIIPDLLLNLENGNVALLQELTNTYGWGWGIDFTFLTYMCTDIVPASSPEQVEAQQIGIPAFDRVDDAPDGRGHSAQAMCERMDVRRPAAPQVVETVPTTPMIVFSGSMDPITAFSSGEQIIDTVPNGIFVGFHDLSHGVTIDPCGAAIAVEFLNSPFADPDTSCSLPENRPPFKFGG